MDKRQGKIMQAVVKEYVRTSNPVGSKLLVQKHNLGLSSATIRNEMKELEKAGYLLQPHTPAGRIPTEKAYRFFIKSLEDKKLDIDIKVKKSSEDVFREMTETLAEMSGGLAFSGTKELRSFYQSGLSNLLKEPEFEDKAYFSEMTKMMEDFEKHFNDLFKQVHEQETKVFIGKENPFGRTKKITLIVSRCRIPKKKHGVIGLMGPMRMRYDYNISLINKLKELLEDYE